MHGWFLNYFLNGWKIQNKNLALKVLLTMDNALVHIKKSVRRCERKYSILFLPSNTSTLIRPMNQRIIKAFKSHCIKEVYGQNVSYLDLNSESWMINFWKTIAVTNVIDYIHLCWNNIMSATLYHCWKIIWPGCLLSYDNDKAKIQRQSYI